MFTYQVDHFEAVAFMVFTLVIPLLLFLLGKFKVYTTVERL